MLQFVSSNQEKMLQACAALEKEHISVERTHMELAELQSDQGDIIIRNKAHQAFSHLKRPIIVSDHLWSFTALHGFPGPYMKYINQWLTASDLLLLMQDKKNREAVLSEYICYKDEVQEKVFVYQYRGEVLFKSQGNGLPCQEVVSLSGDGISIAEYIRRGKSSVDHRKLWEQFAIWYHALPHLN